MVEGRFVTFILGVIDIRKSTFTFANAGHMTPLIRRASGNVNEVDDVSIGIPVGIMQDYPYEVVEHKVEPGDTWVLLPAGLDHLVGGSLLRSRRVVVCVRYKSGALYCWLQSMWHKSALEACSQTAACVPCGS